jgi:hypothetical protein
MRTSKSLTISLPPQQLREMERTAKRENRTLSELLREAWRRYQREEEDRRLAVDPARQRRLLELKKVVGELRQEAAETGVDKMTTRDINTIVAEARREQKKKIKQPTS